MALIRPFRAWRYNRFLSKRLYELSAPISETLAHQKKEILYRQPYHNFHIASPLDVPPFSNVSRRLENWKLDKVIEQDALPAIYVYAQVFHLKTHPGESYRRRGFIAYIKNEPYEKQIVLPHEMTIPQAVDFRLNLLEHTQMHTHPTHGFYTDPAQDIEPYLEESLKNPAYRVTDDNGTEHLLSQIHDWKVIEKIIQTLKNKKVWIADGHHRYESSLHFNRKLSQLDDDPKLLHHFHLMWLTNTESSELGILPTHRIVQKLPGFEQASFLKKLADFFYIEKKPFSADLGLCPEENMWTFLLFFKNELYQIRLREELFGEFASELPDAVKKLDVSVLHYFILDQTLGLNAKQQFEHLDYSQYIHTCVDRVQEGRADFAVIVRKITLEEIERVSFSGYTMPAKATYFFPKVLGGLVFGSIREDER